MIDTVPEINNAAKNPQVLIDSAEKQYLSGIYSTAKTIADDDRIKIVALAGPSASGKTTTAHILQKRLETIGEKTAVVSLDDFYLEEKDLPLLPDGNFDTESVNSLNIDLINKCFKEIINTGKTVLPRFDFANKKSIINDREIDISDKGIIIVEGLHALNPMIGNLVPREKIYKIYVSVNCSIGDNFGEQLLSSRQIRLVRRMIRDRISRGTSAEQTLAFWNGVVSGERKHLYCYKDTADIRIKTLHIYEPCVYRRDFLKLKEQVSSECVCYDYFMRTVSAMEKFVDIDSSLVPKTSLIREFIGAKPT